MGTGKERPILMNGEMVRAILDGRKGRTRRVVKPQPLRQVSDWTHDAEAGERVIYRGWPHRLTESGGRHKAAAGELTPVKIKCLYGAPGDRLWVRETWALHSQPMEGQGTGYVVQWKADESNREVFFDGRVKRNSPSLNAPQPWPANAIDKGWRPSIHMPRWASRITLEVTGVRVERVQEIDNNDADAEGTTDIRTMENNWDMRDCFASLWDSINAKRGYSWASNPWVWVVEFKRA